MHYFNSYNATTPPLKNIWNALFYTSLSVFSAVFFQAASCWGRCLPVAVLVFLIRKQMRTFICLVHLLTCAPTQTLLPQLATRNAKFSRYCSTPATSRRTKPERNFAVFPSLASLGCKFSLCDMPALATWPLAVPIALVFCNPISD